jgi:hypothetical protein
MTTRIVSVLKVVARETLVRSRVLEHTKITVVWDTDLPHYDFSV